MAATAGTTETGGAAAWRTRLEHALRPWRRASRTAKGLVLVGLLITSVFAAMAVFTTFISPYGGEQYRHVAGGTQDPVDLDGRCGEDFECEQIPKLEAPSAEHPFGTTFSRFDVLSRIVHGAQLAFAVMLLSTVLAMAVGVPLGLWSGYRGGRIDRLLVMTMDAVYAFPPLVLAIIVAFVLKEFLSPGLPATSVAVGVVYIPQYYRVIRNHTLSVKEEPYVEAARSLGARPRTIMWRYVFFNVIQSVPVIFTLNAADAVLTLAGLGFLGFGVEFPTPEWGLDVSRAISDVVSGFWWTALFPGLAITLLVTGLTLVGEGLNDIINPLLRVRGYQGQVPGTAPGADAGTGGASGTPPGETGAEARQPESRGAT